MSQDHACQQEIKLDLQSLDELSAKVARVHGGSDPRLFQVREVFLGAAKNLKELEAALALLRGLTDGYAPPPNACRSYRGLFEGLSELDKRFQRNE